VLLLSPQGAVVMIFNPNSLAAPHKNA